MTCHSNPGAQGAEPVTEAQGMTDRELRKINRIIESGLADMTNEIYRLDRLATERAEDVHRLRELGNALAGDLQQWHDPIRDSFGGGGTCETCEILAAWNRHLQPEAPQPYYCQECGYDNPEQCALAHEQPEGE